MATRYETNDIFVESKVLNNALLKGAAGEVFKKGQLLTAEADGFKAFNGNFTTTINAVALNDVTIPAGQTSIRQPVATGEMNLTGIITVNGIGNADIDKLKLAAFKSGIYLN